MNIKDIIRLIKDEPESPDPCTKIRAFIHQGVLEQDEELLLYLLRQVIRQTKENIIINLQREFK